MNFSNLCLVITDKCNAQCEFCCFSCTPKNTQVMSEDLMFRAIHDAKKIGISGVGFSGGECFLYPELLLKGAQEARRNDMTVFIASNGFWGSWENEKIIDYLKKLNPDKIAFSRDFFHEKYVKQEDFDKAFKACQELNISCELEVADFNGEYSAGRYLQSLGEKKYVTQCRFYAAYRAGRALNLPEEMFLNFADSKHAGCIYDGKISVFYNGDVYPCCRHEVYGTQMKVGNMTEKSLQQVLSESYVPKICDVILNCNRMAKLVEIARSKLGYKISEKMGCSCDFCRELFGTEERKKAMLPYVEELYEEILVKAALNMTGQ